MAHIQKGILTELSYGNIEYIGIGGVYSNKHVPSHCSGFESQFAISSLTMESLNQWWSAQTEDVASVIFEVRPPYICPPDINLTLCMS